MLHFGGAKVPIGDVVLTRGVADAIPGEHYFPLLERHARGDWGEVCDEDKQANDWALANNERLLSAYTTPDGVKLWIITERDRSATTILFPDEY